MFGSQEELWQVQKLQGVHFTHTHMCIHMHIHMFTYTHTHTPAPESGILIPALSFTCIIKSPLGDMKAEEAAGDAD